MSRTPRLQRSVSPVITARPPRVLHRPVSTMGAAATWPAIAAAARPCAVPTGGWTAPARPSHADSSAIGEKTSRSPPFRRARRECCGWGHRSCVDRTENKAGHHTLPAVTSGAERAAGVRERGKVRPDRSSTSSRPARAHQARKRSNRGAACGLTPDPGESDWSRVVWDSREEETPRRSGEIVAGRERWQRGRGRVRRQR